MRTVCICGCARLNVFGVWGMWNLYANVCVCALKMLHVWGGGVRVGQEV